MSSELIVGALVTAFMGVLSFYVKRLYKRIDGMDDRLTKSEEKQVKIELNYIDRFALVTKAITDLSAALVERISSTEKLIISSMGEIGSRCAKENGRIDGIEIQIENIKERV